MNLTRRINLGRVNDKDVRIKLYNRNTYGPS